MNLEHHRDLAREFPELKQRVHDLKLESPEFRHLYATYEAVDNEVHRIEQEIETPSDAYTEDLKRRRAQLKDRLYGLLTGRLHPAPDTEDFVVRKKFRTPVDHGEVSRDWSERGYSCKTLAEPPGHVGSSEAYAKDALMTVVEGRVDVEMHSVDYVLEPGDELFIPRGAPFTLRNTGLGETRCFLGLD
jgi:uncharacterized protein YdcH (DUF465 family)/mannose-6-phosphate isomerase-like protein (cupin superfamily)